MLLNFSLKTLNKTGLVVFLLTQSVVLHAEVNASSHDAKDVGVDSLQWPGRMQMGKEIIPPPPPGPYMSLALSDAKQHTFKHGLAKPANRFETADIPIETFSPDIPWPGNTKEPNPWMPKNGYRFVQPSAVQNLNQTRPYATPSYGWPYMNNMGSQRVPSAGTAPNTPYGNNSPGYRYPNHQYQQPTNYYGAPANPVNRAPYPTSNKPSYPN